MSTCSVSIRGSGRPAETDSGQLLACASVFGGMKALRLDAPMRFSYLDVPPPAVGDEDVLVAVRACGICGSDLHGFDGTSGRRTPPLILGHEAAGVVAAVGSRAGPWREGDRVTFESTFFCGSCRACTAGRRNLCESREVLGASFGGYRRDGAFAELVVVPGRTLVRLPDGLTFERAAFGEPLAVALHAVGLAGNVEGATVAVVGTGVIGLLVVQTLRLSGAGRVIGLDLDDRRLDLARRLGADAVIRADRPEVERGLADLTDDGGADVVIEAVGVSKAIRTAVMLTRRGGRVVLVGNVEPIAELPLQEVVTRELTLIGACASSGELESAVELLASGAVDCDPLISAIAPLARGAAVVQPPARGSAGAGQGHPHAGRRRGDPRMTTGLFDLTGRVAMVTGSSSGLGRGMAGALARAGADLVVTSRDRSKLDDTCDEIRSLGRRVFPVELDVREPQSVATATALALEETGRIDILVNNAGCNVRKPTLEITLEDWSTVVDTNLRGPFFVSQAVAPSMIDRRWGRIINIGSLTSVFGFAGVAPYTASRGGIRQLTMSLADEWAMHGITVNCLAPGWFHTAQTDVLFGDDAWVNAVRERIPMRRTGTPEDLAGPVTFLASDASAYVTGQTLLVDGGVTTGSLRALPQP